MLGALLLLSLLSSGLGRNLSHFGNVSFPFGNLTNSTVDDPKPILPDPKSVYEHGEVDLLGNLTAMLPIVERDQLSTRQQMVLVGYTDGSPAPAQAGASEQHEGPLIVNGKNANKNEQPWMVSLQVVIGRSIYHICGGSLWKSNKVITAAHCLDDWGKSDRYYRVAVHYYQLSLGQNNENSEVIKVLNAQRHEQYTGSFPYANDIAVLTLVKSHKIDRDIRDIKMTSYSTRALTGQTVHLTGWGKLSGGGPSADILQQASFTVISTEECQKYYGPQITKQHLCALSQTGSSSCQGDSGGPLVWPETFNYVQEEVGVVSFGPKGCDPTKPQVYQNPAEHQAWLATKA